MNLNYEIKSIPNLQHICEDLLTFDDTKKIVVRRGAEGYVYPATALKPTNFLERLVQWWDSLWSDKITTIDTLMQNFLAKNVHHDTHHENINVIRACQHLISCGALPQKTADIFKNQVSTACTLIEGSIYQQSQVEVSRKAAEAAIMKCTQQKQIAKDALGHAALKVDTSVARAQHEAHKIKSNAREDARKILDEARSSANAIRAKVDEADRMFIADINRLESTGSIAVSSFDAEMPDLVIQFPNCEPIFFHISLLKQCKDSFFGQMDFSELSRDDSTGCYVLDLDLPFSFSHINHASMELCRKFMYGEITDASKRELVQLYHLTYCFGLTNLNQLCKKALTSFLEPENVMSLLNIILNFGYSNLIPVNIREYLINNFDLENLINLTSEERAEFFKMLKSKDTAHLNNIALLNHFSRPEISEAEKSEPSKVEKSKISEVKKHELSEAEIFAIKAIKALSKEASIQGMVLYLNAKEQGFDFAVFENNPSYVQFSINLGKCYASGIGAEQNYTQAFQLFKKVVVSNHAEVYWELGNMLFYGRGCGRDVDECARYFRLAAVHGSIEMKFRVGTDFIKWRNNKILYEGLELIHAAANEKYLPAIKYIQAHYGYMFREIA